MTSQPAQPGRFTGRHMAAIMIGFFAVVVAVNLVMARLAGSTFGGVLVENSYVASQHFNRWLDAAARQDALGWQASLARRADGRLAITMAGAPADLSVAAVARHPLGRLPDRSLAFAREAGETYVSREALPPGRWRLRIAAEAQGQVWRHEADLP